MGRGASVLALADTFSIISIIAINHGRSPIIYVSIAALSQKGALARLLRPRRSHFSAPLPRHHQTGGGVGWRLREKGFSFLTLFRQIEKYFNPIL